MSHTVWEPEDRPERLKRAHQSHKNQLRERATSL